MADSKIDVHKLSLFLFFNFSFVYFSLFRMSEEEEEGRPLGRRDVEEDPRFNTLFSRLQLEDR